MTNVEQKAPPVELIFRSVGKPIVRHEDQRLTTGGSGSGSAARAAAAGNARELSTSNLEAHDCQRLE